jgi:hypothetical protein
MVLQMGPYWNVVPCTALMAATAPLASDWSSLFLGATAVQEYPYATSPLACESQGKKKKPNPYEEGKTYES